jgi:inhibitor of cysteine peptidase
VNMRGLIVIAAAAALAACVAEPKKPSPEAPVTQPSANQGVPAPKLAGAIVRITKEDAGKTIEVGVGATFSVALVGVPTAGYLWKPAKMPAFLEMAGEIGGPTSENQKQPGFTGGNHWEVTGFKAKAAGTGELVFEQRRPWETNEPAADTFSVKIVAK